MQLRGTWRPLSLTRSLIAGCRSACLRSARLGSPTGHRAAEQNRTEQNREPRVQSRSQSGLRHRELAVFGSRIPNAIRIPSVMSVWRRAPISARTMRCLRMCVSVARVGGGSWLIKQSKLLGGVAVDSTRLGRRVVESRERCAHLFALSAQYRKQYITTRDSSC